MEGDVGGQPLTSQRACTKNLVFAEGIEGGDGDGGNGNGVADGIESETLLLLDRGGDEALG